MTYKQRLKNIEVLKNLVLPTETHEVFFDFSDSSEFTMILFKTSVSKDIISDLISIKFRAKLPLAGILFDKLDHEILYYEDYTLRYQYDLTTHEILMHDSKEHFRNFSSAELAIEMNKLLLKLKNM